MSTRLATVVVVTVIALAPTAIRDRSGVVVGPAVWVEPVERLPLITEVMPQPGGGLAAFVELHNPTAKVLDLGGYAVTTGPDPGHTHVFAAGEAAIPPRGYLLLWLDDRLREPPVASLSALVLHAPRSLTAPWTPAEGFAAVRSATGELTAFVAWGSPSAGREVVRDAGTVWRPGWFVRLHDSFGLYELGAAVAPGDSIGLDPGSRASAPADWSVYHEVTPGGANPAPQPGTFTTPDGATVDGNRFSLAWKGHRNDRRYAFQLATAGDFAPQTVVEHGHVDAPLYTRRSPLPDGAYFFRVRAEPAAPGPGRDERRGERWGRPLRFSSRLASCAGAVTVPVQHLVQRKDTPLLCLDGCAPEGDTTTARHWNVGHPNAPPVAGDHGDQNCARAAVAMVATRYGANLSQDRIALFTEEQRCAGVPPPADCSWRTDLQAPEGDLAHGMPVFCGTSGWECPPITAALQWALAVPGAVTSCGDASPDAIATCETLDFPAIQSLISSGRPIVARQQLPHVVVINGVCTSGGSSLVQVLDPMKEGPEWMVFDPDVYRAFWVGPESAPNARSDEAGVTADSDRDGVRDLDEAVRFGTDPGRVDSDADGVADLHDVREYVFSPAGAWDAGQCYEVALGSNAFGAFRRVPDVDGDSLRKELDPDNDGDGCLDGVEDANGNGVWEPSAGESHNFSPDCQPRPQPPCGCRCR